MDIRLFYITFLMILVALIKSYAQPANEMLTERIDYCNLNFPDEIIPELRKELEELEKYFIQNGLLKDSSGNSYYAVYKRIAKENDLTFASNANFKLLDSLDNFVVQKCFYKLLTVEQLLQLTNRHLEASNNIAKYYKGGNITPGTLAQGIIDNLTIEDFDLQYYKLSSLLTFYKIVTPYAFQDALGYSSKNGLSGSDILRVELNENNELLISGEPKTFDQIQEIVLVF